MPHIFIDGHVHIHPGFFWEEVLHHALHNFQRIEEEVRPVQSVRFLLLTESSGVDFFAALAARAAQQGPTLGPFHIRQTSEASTLACEKDQILSFFVVAGRQIVTAERLEVLALGLHTPYPDGQPVGEVLSHLSRLPCLAVLPWGAGKWLGQRGKLVAQLISQAPAAPLFLGDNGNRPFFWPLPPLFARAKVQGIRNLAGSDPLPFPGQEKKVGSFGVWLSGTIDPLQPFSSLCTLLRNPKTALHPFGRCESLYPFFKQQILMQFKKKRPSSPSATP